MEENFFRLAGPTDLPRILIAEKNFSTFESLIDTLKISRLHFDFDVCTSRDHALRKLLGPPYQLIISGAHLAEMDDFFLLKHAQTPETFTPFVVTAGALEKESARRVLAKGAFDLIISPFKHEQAARTIRLALWHNKLKGLIARREKAVAQYREHMAAYPDDKTQMEESFNRTLSAFEATISSIEQTILRLDESMLCFSDFATKMECQIRKQAFERLDAVDR
jgi:DNA-binding NtrC family response regulator